MCGGFNFSKNFLAILNVVYMVVGLLLIGVATYGKTSSVVTSITLLGGIVFCGCLLLFIAAVGLWGALRHHQVVLFFYIAMLFVLFLVQFGVACACLAMSVEQQQRLLESGWRLADNATKQDAQNTFDCCGYNDTVNSHLVDPAMAHPACPAKCCSATDNATSCCMADSCQCDSCVALLTETVTSAMYVAGRIGLFFAFTELIGFAMAYRYRNMVNPSQGIGI